MKFISEHNGIPVGLLTSSIVDIIKEVPDELKGNAIQAISLAGGSFCTFVSDKVINKIVSNQFISDKDKQWYLDSGPHYAITMCDESTRGMTDLEKVAIFHHEMGHIVSGIFDTIDEDAAGLIDDVENELFADKYAAERVGAKVIRKAIKKAALNNARIAVKLNGGGVLKFLILYGSMLKSEGLVKRLAALKVK